MAVLWVTAGDCLQQGRRVTHIARERTDVIERARKRRQSVSRHAAVGRRHAHNSAEGGRLANRAARIRAERHHRCALRDRGGRTSARTSRHALRIDRIAHRTERRILVRRTHRKLVAVGLSDDDAAGLFESITAVAS